MGAEDKIINGMLKDEAKQDIEPRDDQEFLNYLTVGIGDYIMSGSMDSKEGAKWREEPFEYPHAGQTLKEEGMSLKDHVLSSGGKSFEYYSNKHNIPMEDIGIDTVSYKDRLNYDFKILDKGEPVGTDKHIGSSTSTFPFYNKIANLIEHKVRQESGGDLKVRP